MSSDLWHRWQLTTPIVQAPMAGGATTAQLVATVSQAGALGFLAGAMLSPERLLAEVASIRQLTDRPFGINLFVLEAPQPQAEQLAFALKLLAPLHAELGLPPPQVPTRFCESFADQFEALLVARPKVASFTFGMLSQQQVLRLQQADIAVIGTATDLAEAAAWAALSVDALCAQGKEAGGHRGAFLGRPPGGLYSTRELVAKMVQHQPLPVIAAGGLMSGQDIALMLRQGAQACQLGTAFLRCPESGISACWKAELAAARAGSTQLTRAFSGRHARGLSNRYMALMASVEDRLPAYPVMNALTAPLRAAANQLANRDFLSLWAGEGVAASRQLAAAELVAVLHQEYLASVSECGA
ncbi:nitronate monooxygenase [Neisseriaceae bacterium TC5R-5]|nr:nitronate monooxygenase [Neisseriaceae bacterium TC5R-5]